MGIRISELQPAANVNPLDVVPVDQAVGMTRKMTIEQISTVAKTYADKQIAYESQARRQGDADLDAAKINKSAAGERRTFVQEVSVKEVTPSGFVMGHTNANVESGAVTETQFELPQASDENSGIMSAESYQQIIELGLRMDVMEGRGLTFLVQLGTDNPSQSELQETFEAVSGLSGTPPDMTTLFDETHSKNYTFFATSGEWRDMGAANIAPFTQYTHGSIRGSNDDGDIYAKPGGTGGVNGWTGLKTRVGNNESDIADLEVRAGNSESDIANLAVRVENSENGITNLDQRKANLANPTFTGIPNVPTASTAVAASASPTAAQSTRIATVGQIAATRNAINGDRAPIAGPIFTGSPSVQATGNQGTLNNRIAVVPATTSSNETNYPIGSYILPRRWGSPLINSTATIRIESGDITFTANATDSGQVLSGTWRYGGRGDGTGSAGGLARRVL